MAAADPLSQLQKPTILSSKFSSDFAFILSNFDRVLHSSKSSYNEVTTNFLPRILFVVFPTPPGDDLIILEKACKSCNRVTIVSCHSFLPFVVEIIESLSMKEI
ncbi:hypothetical protein AC249_AIPGENE26760 [Exaiptasia diaphana]|nr:hypothetical protein AC249_AIPGENE26760 [Exaiptasia diaphana]